MNRVLDNVVQCSIFNNLSVDIFELLVSSNEVCAIVGVGIPRLTQNLVKPAMNALEERSDRSSRCMHSDKKTSLSLNLGWLSRISSAAQEWSSKIYTSNIKRRRRINSVNWLTAHLLV